VAEGAGGELGRREFDEEGPLEGPSCVKGPEMGRWAEVDDLVDGLGFVGLVAGLFVARAIAAGA
jgi:hypothetical protein